MINSTSIPKRGAVLKKGPLVNLKDMLERIDSVYGESTAIIEKINGKAVSYSAHELKLKVDFLGTALTDMGLKGKNIALVGENSFNWVVAFLAVTCGVGTAIPLDKELTDEELDLLMYKGDAEALICSKTYYSAAKLHIKNDPHFPCVVTNRSYGDEGFCYIEDLFERGRKLIEQGDRRFLDAELPPDALATVNFTSGTTGANKGVMLTQHNIVSNIDGIANNAPLGKVTFSVLPMNHIYELNCNMLPMLYINTVVCINDSLRNLMANFKLYRPDTILIVPLFLEKIYNSIWEEAEKTGQAEKLRRAIALSNKLLKVGIDLRSVLFKKVRESFGGRLSLVISGGAPAEPKYITGLTDLGFMVYIGYGLTEASPIAALNMNGRRSPDSCGVPFPGSEFFINEPDENGIGEVFIRGENVTRGYYNDIVATVESFENGWFKTGDYGTTDENGGLCLKGRKKNLIVLSNGKNVHPEEIESLIREQIPYIRETVVMEAENEAHGKKQKIIKALVYIDSSDLPGRSESEIEDMVNEDVRRVNTLLPGYKTVSSVSVVTEDFEKTSTKKIMRHKVIEKYGTAK